jgi:hexosaminidase
MARFHSSGFRLAARWKPASGDGPPAYVLTLTNHSTAPVSNFRLCVSGPGRVDPRDEVEGAVLTQRLSNFTELTPLDGFVLAPNAAWRIIVRALSYPLRHWSDGATSAYLVLADGSVAEVHTEPTGSSASNKPLLKGTARFAVMPAAGVPVSVIPWPNRVAVSGARPAPAGLAIEGEGAAAKAAAAFCELCSRLFPAEGIARPVSEGGLKVRCVPGALQSPEAYKISFGGEDVVVEASHSSGFLYGLITLGQILRGARLHGEAFSFPRAGEIADQPYMKWRGSHLDVARQFYSSAEVSQFLAVMAWNKLNRFHWHLSDDEAWRVEIDAFPALNSVGSWRGHGLPIPPLLGSGPQPSGGFYSKKAVRDIVALAGSFGISVVPEIDVPGHCFAMLQSIPELRDPDETGDYSSVQGFPNNCLNPARVETYEIFQTIFDELIALFPSKIFHIGADEVPLGAWSGSPQALRRLDELGGAVMAEAHRALSGKVTNMHGADAIEGSGAAILQAEFLERVQRFLALRGCITGGWEEAAHGGRIDKAKSYLVGWRDVEVSGRLAGEGYDIVVSPGQAYYLDMSQSAEWHEPGAGWAGWSGVRETYEFDPSRGWSQQQKEHFLGIQACIWSEPMTDRAVFDRLVFPRLSAIAETAWTLPDAKSWDRFSGTAGLMPNLYGHWETP